MAGAGLPRRGAGRARLVTLRRARPRALPGQQECAKGRAEPAYADHDPEAVTTHSPSCLANLTVLSPALSLSFTVAVSPEMSTDLMSAAPSLFWSLPAALHLSTDPLNALFS